MRMMVEVRIQGKAHFTLDDLEHLIGLAHQNLAPGEAVFRSRDARGGMLALEWEGELNDDD